MKKTFVVAAMAAIIINLVFIIFKFLVCKLFNKYK